jgi:uncharacterized membrane protein YoaK (UPF0700 family)
VADNVLNAVIDDFVRHRNGLFRVAGVVVLHGNQLIALNAALALMSLIAWRAPLNSMSPHWATGPDIAPTTATLISLAKAAWDIASATNPAIMVFAFLFMLQNPVRDVV